MPSITRDDDIARELRSGLTARPRTLPPRWLYDERGSELFTEITRLPEYYPTEAERSIFREHATLIAEIADATTFVELGSGTSDKTRSLLDAMVAHGTIERFVPLDVSGATLLDAAPRLRERYPGVEISPVVGDFTRHLHRIPEGVRGDGSPGQRLVAFLGGTIGNFHVEERRAFLGALADVLRRDDWFLLGVDLVKPLDRLVAAYDDPGGVTEAFIRNALVHVNREFDGDLDVGAFAYVPFWDAREERLDLRLRAAEPVQARLVGLDLDLDLAAGEEIRIEISAKFRVDALRDELVDAGFGDAPDDLHVLTDRAGDFGALLTRRS